MNEFPVLEPGDDNIVLFHPHVPARALELIQQVLESRWIGQGPKVAEFERRFAQLLAPEQTALAVGSGTDALHLAYLLAGLQAGDEVIAPVFTCTATNLPFLYMGVKPVFADVQPRTLNLDPAHVRSLITPRTKAIVCVHYGGLPCDLDELHALAREHGLVFIEAMALHTPAWHIAPGDMVTTGTITDAWPLLPGQTWTTALSGARLTPLTLNTEA